MREFLRECDIARGVDIGVTGAQVLIDPHAIFAKAHAGRLQIEVLSEKTLSLVRYFPVCSPSIGGTKGSDPVAITALRNRNSRPSTSTVFGAAQRVCLG